MEKEPIVNRFISVPRDKSSLNCAVLIAGIVEAVLTGTGFVGLFTNLKEEVFQFVVILFYGFFDEINISVYKF